MAETVTLRSSGPEATRELAAAAAPLLRRGDVVALSGELGAGKTCFVQGAARALGVEERVTSPTFMLVRTYDGTLPVVHCDVYRLDRLQDVYDLGEEVMSPEAVTFLEWGDAVAALLPDDRLEVELLIDDHEQPDDPDEVGVLTAERVLHLRGHGRWAERVGALAEACAPWRGSAPSC